MSKSREAWVDNVKVFACILVTLGHFFQSMTKGNFIPSSTVTNWFDHTIYFFHVPLFFICSGFVYQKYSRIETFRDWTHNILKKIVSLGIPFFVFSIATWLLKSVFSSSVNIQNGGLLELLFITPVPPYWFLYVLFFMFVLIPTFPNDRIMVGISVAALACKVTISLTGEFSVYLVSKLFANSVWFVAGMVIARTRILERFCNRRMRLVGVILGICFVAASFFTYDAAGSLSILSFVMGILGCTATVLIMKGLFAEKKQGRASKTMTRYTMPVFFMHTIFAAGWRAALLKLGIDNAVVHIVSGMIISFAGPVVAAMVMEKVKFLDFVLYPGRYITIKKKTGL